MSDISISSKEQLEVYAIPSTSLNNGDFVRTYTFGRNNYNNSIYVNYNYFRTAGKTGILKPIVYRGYYDANKVLQYDSITYAPVTITGNNKIVVFPYQSTEERNYINYRVEFECIDDVHIFDINEVGLLFEASFNNKGIIGTSNRTISFSSSKRQDINQNFLTYQTYDKFYAVSLLTNRDNLVRIENIFTSPFKIVDVKNGCIDNSTRELALMNMSINYDAGTQYFTISIKCNEEI